MSQKTGVTLAIEGADSMARVADHLKGDAGKDLKKRLNKRFRDLARPMTKDVKRAAKGISMEGSNSGRGFSGGAASAARLSRRGELGAARDRYSAKRSLGDNSFAGLIDKYGARDRSNELAALERWGKKGTSLRQTLASSIKTKIDWRHGRTLGMRLYVSKQAFPYDQRKLPGYIDNTKPWRHPVMGNMKAWASQRSRRPFFKPVLMKKAGNVRRNILAALEEAEKEIARNTTTR